MGKDEVEEESSSTLTTSTKRLLSSEDDEVLIKNDEPVNKKIKSNSSEEIKINKNEAEEDEDEDEEKQNLTLEQFTDIVLASEGFNNNINNNNKCSIKEEIDDLKNVRVKPVVLAPRVHPINHNIGKYPVVPSQTIPPNSVVVSVKPRVKKCVSQASVQQHPRHSRPQSSLEHLTLVHPQIRPAAKTLSLPQSRPPNIPLLVEEWFQKMKPPPLKEEMIHDVIKYNKEDGVLNLSKKDNTLTSSSSPSSLVHVPNNLIISSTPYVKPPLSPPRLEIRKIEKKLTPIHPKSVFPPPRFTSNEYQIDSGAIKCRAIRDIEMAHTKDMHGNYPIHVAVLIKKEHLLRRYACVLQLLESTVDLVNDDKYTPLHLAILDNNIEIVELLLAFGANPGKRDHRGNTCFHQAVAIKSHQVLKLLVEHVRLKDELDTLNESGITPLHIAMKKNDPISVRILLQNGANLNIPETTKEGSSYYYAKETFI